MQCPGCGDELKAATIAGFDYSFRCDRCGGVWTANWVVNNLASGKPLELTSGKPRIMISVGKNVCPTDQSLLVDPPAGAVPQGMAVKKCNQCGWWWFPGDEIFKFVEVFKAKTSYIQVWERREWVAYAWPALVLVIMVLGLGASVSLVRNRQTTATKADVGVVDFLAIPWGEGRMEIRFRATNSVENIEYRMKGGLEFVNIGVDRDGDFYVVRLESLKPGTYEVNVSGKLFEMQVR